MARQMEEDLAGLQVPDLHGVVIGTGGEAAAVSAESKTKSPNRIGVSRQGKQRLAGGRIPDADGLLGVESRQQSAVPAKIQAHLVTGQVEQHLARGVPNPHSLGADSRQALTVRAEYDS